MPITRRQFIKRGFGAVTIGLAMPHLLIREASAQSTSGSGRKVFVIIQLEGGNDGLNTVVPYTDPNYSAMRPRIGFLESEIANTIISDQFALHPSMTALKGLYDSGQAAIVLGVGYPNPNLSHFTSQDIWHTADPTAEASEGWIGVYADKYLVNQPSPAAASVGTILPLTMVSNDVIIPNIDTFSTYNYETDGHYSGDATNQMNAFAKIYNRSFESGSFIETLTATGKDAVDGAAQITNAVAAYTSAVTYPDTALGAGMQMLAEIITTIPSANVLYCVLNGFDTHSSEIGDSTAPTSRLVGTQATLLGELSDGVSAFYSDMVAHNLADNVVMMTWSEFGRRVNDNSSNGTDHGTASVQFIIGNPVKGGQLYGVQPSLAPTALDSSGNMVFQVDFRSTYATILDKWLGVDSSAVLGGSFEDLGFL
ncbi:MAG TPA: DUF1501 domain-containing protein [Blastocatellia bacterium]